VLGPIGFNVAVREDYHERICLLEPLANLLDYVAPGSDYVLVEPNVNVLRPQSARQTAGDSLVGRRVAEEDVHNIRSGNLPNGPLHRARPKGALRCKRKLGDFHYNSSSSISASFIKCLSNPILRDLLP
jgi:hypothetical protein